MLPKAITVVSEHMHLLFAVEPWIAHADKSKECCILCSLTVRDFLHGIGFTDAVARPVSTYIDAQHNGKRLSRLIIGHPKDDHPVKTMRWQGHMVCVVPSHGMLIDTTLHQAQRPAWPELPGIVAVPLMTSVTSRADGRLSGVACRRSPLSCCRRRITLPASSGSIDR
jgi:hypothetical protein